MFEKAIRRSRGFQPLHFDLEREAQMGGFDIQETTVFSAALQPGAAQADAANAFVRFITSPVATPVIKKSGMEPG
jgi:hypothetical protein